MHKNNLSSAKTISTANAIAKPDICVVIPNFNGVPFISRAIDSVLQNVTLRIQLIVVDDGSDDNSIKQISGFGDQLTLIRFEENVGPNIVRNAGLDACAAEFVMFLDNDDFLVPGGVTRALIELRESGADVLIGSFEYASADTEWERQTTSKNELCDGAATLKKWTRGDWVPPCSVIWKSDFIRRIGSWSEDANRTNDQDGELVFRAAIHGGRFLWSVTNIGVYFQHTGLRTSQITSVESMELKLKWVRSLFEEAMLHNGELSQFIASYALQSARLCFSLGYTHTGREFHQLARSIGIRSPPSGSVIHVVVTHLIGLERKEQISRIWKKYKMFRRRI